MVRGPLGRIPVRLKHLASHPGVAGLVPATPIILAPCLNLQGRRDEPGDEAHGGFQSIDPLGRHAAGSTYPPALAGGWGASTGDVFGLENIGQKKL